MTCNQTVLFFALRHRDAIGQIQLARTNKRNEKHLSITAWPEDTVGLNDEGFHKEINAFCGKTPCLPAWSFRTQELHPT